MNETDVAPRSLDDVIEAVRSSPRVIPVGNETKPPLSNVPNVTRVSFREFRGIVQYEPSEFTFTAKAGTSVEEISDVLSQHRQYLPFDPMLIEAGSTIGGTVGAGLSGPGRFRFGGLRDFLLGVQFVTGDAITVNSGGKVVKNAAGFDLPKFLVGSFGRFGVMTELTFKVFPRPAQTRTLQIHCGTHQTAATRIAEVACSRLEPFAIDYRPATQKVAIQLGGPESSLAKLSDDLRQLAGEDVAVVEDEVSYWRGIRELSWTPAPIAVKVASTLRKSIELCEHYQQDDDVALHLSVAGDVIWMLIENEDALARVKDDLQERSLAGLIIRGPAKGDPRIGHVSTSKIQTAIQRALDPPGRFCP